METATFIVRAGMPAGIIPTVHGPFADETAAIAAAAAGLQPGAYTVFSGAKAGKTFKIAAPVVTFDK